MEPKAVHLKDYRPSIFGIDSIELDVDIYDDRTVIKSKLQVFKRPEHTGQRLDLELNGEGLKLIHVKFDGVTLKPDQFILSTDKLIIPDIVQDKFCIEIQNEIYPQLNKSMEGFYQSGEQFCTQCEPEGFRKITYYIDRPDVMATFRTKMTSDKRKLPYLLSNGNKIASGNIDQNRHWAIWEDPFRKPCYLFAMVAGDFDIAHDSFKTKSGREVKLELFVDKGNLNKTSHALSSLKKSMKWDEDTFGLEYDLDIYMIVAVDSFNMGAMENKGLNIFNSAYALAAQDSATDHDFQNIESVIGHEYFHNWTGNRVTCRDWFQLTLKEGLTVFRDQEFSSDMLSRAVKRIEDVRALKELQFPEDAGPLSHPIRPSTYIEINNFYTRTIYEKGAEVIRMVETLLGKDLFRKGIDKYFELFDGQAVTTEDFIHAMELASKRDLTQFKNWYSTAGTPKLVIQSEIKAGSYTLHVEQKYPKISTELDSGSVLHMPFKIAFLSPSSQEVREHTIEITKLKESFEFHLKGDWIISLNRGFSAPVIVDYGYEFSDLLTLMSFDTDPYSRYEATQKVYDKIFKDEYDFYIKNGYCQTGLDKSFSYAFKNLLLDENIDLSFKSYLLELPTLSRVCQETAVPDFDVIHTVLSNLKLKLGVEFFDWFKSEHFKLSSNTRFELTPESFGKRALKNQCLSYLVASKETEGMNTLDLHYKNATNMTEEIQGLSKYIMTGADLNHTAVRGFYEKWKHDGLVMLKWFGAIAAHSPKEVVLQRLALLEKDPCFKKDVPNYLRNLYIMFAKNNLTAFHAKDGSGYRFLAERIKLIDKFNPQVASRIASSFSLINKVDEQRKILMVKELRELVDSGLSKDTFEVVSKYLG